MKRIRVMLSGIFMSFFFLNSFGSHLAGNEIFYRWVSDSTLEFTVTGYYDCNGISPPQTIRMHAKAPSINMNLTNAVTLNQIAYIYDQNNEGLYNCTQSQSSLCYDEVIYRGTWAPPARAKDWVVYNYNCCRPTIINPQNIAQNGVYFDCGINNYDWPLHESKNSSPFWHNRVPSFPNHLTDTMINFLFRTVCECNYYTLDMSTTEYDGDSVQYEFYVPQVGVGGSPATYTNGFSFQKPVPLCNTNDAFTINPVTGIIPFTPGAPTQTNGSAYIVGIKATEYRYDTVAIGNAFYLKPITTGYVKREFTLWVDNANNCRRDSLHPSDLEASCGDTILDVQFHNGNLNEPNSWVRCETISPDGSEFRIADSSYYNYQKSIGNPVADSLVDYIGVNRAVWNCRAGNTDVVTLHLSEPLRYEGEYYLFLKTGSDLDVLESECGFLEPEFSSGEISLEGEISVDLGLPSKIAICLSDTNPFPALKAVSPDAVYYWWTLDDGSGVLDTIQEGREADSTWGDLAGTYKINVIGEYGCPGSDEVEIFFPEKPYFKFEPPIYCDEYDEPIGMPPFLIAPPIGSGPDAPNQPGYYEWSIPGVGVVHIGDTLDSSVLSQNTIYRLRYVANPAYVGATGCEYSETIFYNRDSMPPQDPLYVRLDKDTYALCSTDSDVVDLEVWNEGMRQYYAPFRYKWFEEDIILWEEQGDKLTVSDSAKYSVRVEDTLGCWGTDTARIVLEERQGSFGIACSIFGENLARFTWEPVWNARYYEVSLDGGITWDRSSGSQSHEITNIVQQQHIMVRAVTTDACGYTDYRESDQCPDKVFPPNVFTPNKDGMNDYFVVRGLDLFPGSRLQVYDRWGKLVYEDDDYRNDWDGDDNPDGTYMFIVEVKDPDKTVHKGMITLLR